MSAVKQVIAINENEATRAEGTKAGSVPVPAGIGGTGSEFMRPLRRRLPDERRAIIHHFSIAGQEGYLTVGVYDDGLRNSHDKSFRLGCTVGLRVFVCENLAFHGEYTPVLAKHSKHFSLEDSLAIGVDRMQRNFGPLKQQVEEWQAMQLSAASAKLLIYQAFIEDELGFPKHLARRVHELYFQPVHEEFQARTMWSLSNAFTSAFKELEPIPQYKATAKLAGFLQSVRPQ